MESIIILPSRMGRSKRRLIMVVQADLVERSQIQG